MYRKNGARFAIGGERRPAGLRNRTPANCRWIGYAARDHRQHHGTLRDCWGTRRGIAEGRAWIVNLEPKPKPPQWLAFTPYELVKAHLNIDRSVLASVSTILADC